MDIYHLRTEAEPEEKTALNAVIDHIKDEMERLNKMEEEIMSEVRCLILLHTSVHCTA
jgi:ATP-binding cassette subfamily F protein 2